MIRYVMCCIYVAANRQGADNLCYVVANNGSYIMACVCPLLANGPRHSKISR